MHDKRSDDGMYRCCTPAETRAKTARTATQTHEGKFTHHRETERHGLGITQTSAKLFIDKRVNRRPYMPSGVK